MKRGCRSGHGPQVQSTPFIDAFNTHFRQETEQSTPLPVSRQLGSNPQLLQSAPQLESLRSGQNTSRSSAFALETEEGLGDCFMDIRITWRTPYRRGMRPERSGILSTGNTVASRRSSHRLPACVTEVRRCVVTQETDQFLLLEAETRLALSGCTQILTHLANAQVAQSDV